jgi:hypothetical protein
MPYFISHSQICDKIIIHRITVKLSLKSRQNDQLSIATARQLIPLQIGEWEMKQGITVHISCIENVAIRRDLQ